jgi:hypothetical protein
MWSSVPSIPLIPSFHSVESGRYMEATWRVHVKDGSNAAEMEIVCV